MPAEPCLTLIVACANNGVIGSENKMAWTIPEELAHFKAATMGHTLLMGRKTWDSIGRALPGRRTIVISRSPGFRAAGAEVAASLPAALELAVTSTCEHPGPSRQIFIAGGAQTYAQTLTQASRILLTRVDLNPPGDVRFEWEPDESWRCEKRSAHRSRTGIDYEIQDWRRLP